MPNSILWIGLVVLWVFVLFPMLADRHPRIRRTTDAALATRVLHRGGTRRRTTKGPAAGHESDPDWVPTRVQRKLPHGDDSEDRMTTSTDESVTEDDETARDDENSTMRAANDDDGVREHDNAVREADSADDAAADEAEFAADPVRRDEEPEFVDQDSEFADEEPEFADNEPVASAMARIPPARSAARPERLSEDPADHEFDSADPDFVPTRRGRGGFDPEADAIARATRYRFRQRTALGLVLSLLLFGGFALAVSPMLWWGCGLSAALLVVYLFYLRRQVRMEEEIRRRRAARLARGRRASSEEPAAERPDRTGAPADRDSSRALRRRAVVLDVDDEDPMFDHLEPFDAAAARATRNRAAGGEIRRAAGE
ncbi:hypothetical protein IU500_06180 [Nocardia terpenica]|uniref:divisome protein SepX/GlpR n=1 Tax=Nocardia terpenica TaxID=455432 RepID=UPI00189371AF|nr:gephyrin-like molybdotransferase receptor GlpR [Nocardia terpenica]MBF6060365.1 hypothetical protein [Nocardia terpenica]MBF6103625.1 hypothetical protein [Nocardia terpenica]MBF6112001.1 hypothetical protein [Nocardia terpenica]MBF6117846.1 hypothetical protein [Nocardia terpenica]MBF6153410.1 hypothetical protein [Nocardia terpenica]